MPGFQPQLLSLVEVGMSFDTGITRGDALGSGLDEIPPGSV